MIHLVLPFALASILAGAGVHAILARRNAVLMLIGVELVLAAAGLILVTASAVLPDRDSAGQILAVFVITLAAAEVTLALGIILFAFRQRGHIDLTQGLYEDGDLADNDDSDARDAVAQDAAVHDDDVAQDDVVDAEPVVARPGTGATPVGSTASASTTTSDPSEGGRS